jgi:L-ribulose-5-phosphate 3-epimerase UlaE
LKPILRPAAASAVVSLAPRSGFRAATLRQAKSIARRLGLTLRKVSFGGYRVNFRDGNETTAQYTDNLEDAVKTAVEMARKRA